jgi:hypothetical protein
VSALMTDAPCCSACVEKDRLIESLRSIALGMVGRIEKVQEVTPTSERAGRRKDGRSVWAGMPRSP